MEEVINKPDNQFKAILNEIIDYKNHGKNNALIKELTHRPKHTKPATSLGSSAYSSAASSSSSSASSSSSSTSSTSDSSTNSSSSTSSTLSSPSQSSQTNNKSSNNAVNDFDKLEIAKMEDLGKTAKILEHRLAANGQKTTALNGGGHFATTSHSDKSSLINDISSMSQIAAHQYTSTNPTHTNAVNLTSESIIAGNSWRTISAKRDKRRRKPAEQPVLSQHIPGHKGEQEVDWLVNFIESGTGSTNNGSNKNNSKNKPQNKLDNNHHNNVSRNNTKSSTLTTMTTTSTNNTKKNETYPVNNHKSHQASSKMSANNIQAKDATQPNHQLQQPQPTNQSPQARKPIQTEHDRESQQRRTNNNKASQHPRQHFKQVSNIRNSYSIQTQDLIQTPTAKQSQQQKPQSEQLEHSSELKQVKQAVLSQQNEDQRPPITQSHDDAVVTFADHIRVNEEDIGQYTFGFFDEQLGNQVNHNKSTKSNQNSLATNHSYKQTNQMVQKQKPKHSKASPNSEKKRYKFNDNIDANSFNYNQILEFISNAWENTLKSQQVNANPDNC